MSRMSEDHRTAGEELAVVLKWTFIAIVILSVICIAAFLWAAYSLHAIPPFAAIGYGMAQTLHVAM